MKKALSYEEDLYHRNKVQVIRNQVTIAEAMLVTGEISGSKLKKIRAECFNLEKGYVDARGLSYKSGVLYQESERYEEEEFSKADPEAAPEAGRSRGSSPADSFSTERPD